MFLNCFASCTRCLTARREQSPADRGQSAPIVAGSVPDQVAPEVAPGAAQVPAAIGANGPEPPFETKLGFCNIMAKVKILRVTVDQRVPVNVVTKKFLAALGFKPQQHAMPSDLGELAAQVFPGHYGWQTLCLSAPAGHGGHTSDVDFVVVGDDYHCDVQLGCEFNRLILRPGLGIYPNYLAPNGKCPQINDPCLLSASTRSVKHRMLTTIFSCRR